MKETFGSQDSSLLISFTFHLQKSLSFHINFLPSHKLAGPSQEMKISFASWLGQMSLSRNENLKGPQDTSLLISFTKVLVTCQLVRRVKMNMPSCEKGENEYEMKGTFVNEM